MTIDASALRRPRAPVDRSTDRLVALASIALAVGFLVAAVLATLLPAAIRLNAWLPLHLALAGGATTAIAGVMPFFTAALAAAPPTDARLRSAAVGAVAVGAAGVSFAMPARQLELAVAAGVAFVTGVVLVGFATIRPLGRALGPSRGLITRGYLAALASVVVGATLATLYVAGWPPVAEGWPRVRVAHAWLNLVGFVSVVISTTLLHFFPTVVGTRIAARPSARLTVAGLSGGSLLVSAGIVLGSDPLARLGGAAAVGGAVGLGLYAWQTWRTRARWTTDPGWHRFAMGGLVSAIAWFALGMTIAGGRVALFGADPAGWSVVTAGGPLVAGWMGLTVVASATHLVPAVGPGDQAAHSRQRRVLGAMSWPRLVAIDLGVAAMSIGLPFGAEPLAGAGLVLIAVGLGLTVVLLTAAVAMGLRGPARPGGRRGT
jgi:nitrite reductase (NO-forming)